jgi:hypothetical protein
VAFREVRTVVSPMADTSSRALGLCSSDDSIYCASVWFTAIALGSASPADPWMRMQKVLPGSSTELLKKRCERLTANKWIIFPLIW